jgi:aryl-alcohol dehydrogenase-like predicted oxidoreductase
MTDWLEPRPAGAPVGIVCGTMNFGKRTPEDEAHRIVARALERGVTLFDTANAYGDSELILGRALRGRREARIATKVGSRQVEGGREGLRADVVLRACDESLRRLGVDRVDLYYLHWPDMRTPLEETLSALQKLVRAGKIAHWGISNYASWQLVDMEHICERIGLARPSTAQQMYNLLVRQLDVEWWAFARQHPIHTTVYNPLAGGLLAGRALRVPPPKGSRFDGNKMYQRRYLSDRFFEVVESYSALAREAGLKPVELAYGWLASQPAVDSVLLGPADVSQLDAGIDACAKPLPADLCARIDEVYRAYIGTDATYARLDSGGP